MNHVLLVDDDTLLTELISEYLVAEGLKVSAVHDGEAGIKAAEENIYDVIVLDSMMPKVSGLDVLKTIRKTSHIPIIMLTAKGDDIDRIIGLEMGADDYVPKPCTPRELLARINAILRRSRPKADGSAENRDLAVGNLLLSSSKRQVVFKNKPLDLTSTEFNLLEVLVKNAGQVVSKEKLSEEALERKLVKFDRSIDVHISSIRHKLGRPELIQTVRGLGYQYISD